MREFDADFGITNLAEYFHADWSLMGSPTEVLAHFLSPELYPSTVSALARDARILREGLSGEAIDLLWMASTEGFAKFRETIVSGRQWTDVIDERCQHWFAAHPEAVFNPVDPEPGLDHLDEVLNEIDVLAEAWPTVRQPWLLSAELMASALRQCALRCTPDLALRFLLRTIDRTMISLTRADYTRLEHLGQALSYGEFLVPSLDYLLEE